MAYQEITGIADAEALIDAICTFVGGQGWTVERNNLSAGVRTATVRMVGLTDYVHLINVGTSDIQMRVSVGYNGSLAPSAQPNVMPFDSLSNQLTGPYSRVYFFMDDDAVHIVVSTSASEQYRHLCFGMIDKIGTYDGGTYADGTYRAANYLGDFPGHAHHSPFYGGSHSQIANLAPYPGAVRADVSADSRTNFFHWFGDGNAPSVTYGRAHTGLTTWEYQSASGYVGYLAGGADRNLFSGRSILHPIHIFVDRTGSPVYRSPIGTVRNTRFCNLAKLAVAQEITIGSEVWKVFPILKRSMVSNPNSSSPDYGSHTAGYAIKKVV